MTIADNAIDITVLQLNATVGDLHGNADKILRVSREPAHKNSDLIVTPEGGLTGYPLDDLVFRPSFMEAVEKTVLFLAREARGGPPLLIGAPWRKDGALVNAALLLRDGKIAKVIAKRQLANGGPFHEMRHYTAGTDYKPIVIGKHRIGVLLCRDVWTDDAPVRLKQAGAKALIAMNASPFRKGIFEQRLAVTRHAVQKTGLPLIYANMVGGQDELLFDGASFVLDSSGKIVSSFPAWEEKADRVRLSASGRGGLEPQPWKIRHRMTDIRSLYSGLVMGIRDYAGKNDFKSAVIGLSGGIDSALTTTLACDALGPDKVTALMLPSKFTSQESFDVAEETCGRLGCHYSADLEITGPFKGMKTALEKRWGQPKSDLTYQNIQARLRTLFLFAVSNDEDMLVLNTSNKSEVAMGHSTFYGDTSGGFAPIKDVFKLGVYDLSAWRNRHTIRAGKGPSGPVIDERILTREPMPELSDGEIDRDILPPYPILDPILQGLVEEECGIEDLVSRGFNRDTVTSVYKKLQEVEFKRFQTPPGPKVSAHSFGRRERLYPVTNKYRDYNY